MIAFGHVFVVGFSSRLRSFLSAILVSPAFTTNYSLLANSDPSPTL
jgi:hypothetical protein